MPNGGKRASKLDSLRSWFRNRIPTPEKPLVEPVPNDIALCEFDCRKMQCRYDEWESCGRRLRFERLRREYEARSCCRDDDFS